MSFAALRRWANRQDEDVRDIVSNAARRAHYEKPRTASQFRQALARKWKNKGGRSVKSDEFRELVRLVCERYQRKGEVIPKDRIPKRVCRVLSRHSFSDRVGEAVRLSWNIVDRLVRLPPIGVWGKASMVFLPGKVPPSLKIRLAYDTKSGENRAVFAAFEVESGKTPRLVSGPHNPLWNRFVAESGPYGNLAAYAVWLLGLSPTPGLPPPGNESRILLEYEADGFKDWRYPVPPDARDNPLFRPVSPKSSMPYGRTYCLRARESDWKAGKVGTYEAVHENTLLSLDRVDLVTMGDA